MTKINAVKSVFLIAGAVALGLMSGVLSAGNNTTAPIPVVLNDNSGWCWFQDERAILDGHRLVFTGVQRKKYGFEL